MKFLCCNPARLIQENYYFPPWKQILQINAQVRLFTALGAQVVITV